MADYTLSARIVGDSSSLNRSVDNASSKLEKFSKKMESISNKMKDIGTKMSVGLTVPITLAGKKMITAASDFEENLNKVDVAFGKSAQSVKDWSETALKQFGLSKNQALQATSLFGDMATSMGLSQPAAASMSTSLAGLAGDLASFKNVSIDQAMTALNGVFTGETESLKQLGVVMTETNLEEFASKTGKVYKEMSQAEKVQLRYAYVMDMTKNAQGDYARTSDGTANSVRTFQGALDNLNIVLGQKLLPIFTPIIQKATELIEKFANASPEIQNIVLKIGGLLAIAGPLLVGLGSFIGAISKIVSVVKIVISGISMLGSVFTVLTSPITLIILAIAAFVAVLVYLWKTNETFRNIVMQAWLSIQYTLSNIWNSILKPIFLEIAKIAMDIYNNGIKPLWEKIQEFVVFFIGALSQMWNKIAPFVNMFIDKFGGVIVQVISSVARGFGNAIKNIMSLLGAWLDNIKQVINGVKQIFNGIIDFVTGVFTGNWEKAWDGVKQIFGGIFESLGGLIKMPMNTVIGIVNDVISRINGISIDIPDFIPGIGGKHFGVDIPTIPYLKRGTDDFAGGFARINEAGRGELVNLPNGTQVIPHDISIKYAKESARINSNSTTDIDYSKIGEYVVNASSIYAKKIADGVEKGIAKIKVISNNRETARFLVDLGFVKG